MTGKVEDVMRQIPSSEDMYVTMQGRVPKRSEKLKSCGVADGCTIQVVSRLRGGGRNKSKMTVERKKKSPKKAERSDQNTTEKSTSETNAVFEMFDKCSRTGMGGWSAEMMETMLEMDDDQTERMLGMLRSSFPEEICNDFGSMNEETRRVLKERRRREKDQQKEEVEEQQQQKQEKEVRTGRANAGLVRGEDERCRGNEASGKGK